MKIHEMSEAQILNLSEDQIQKLIQDEIKIQGISPENNYEVRNITEQVFEVVHKVRNLYFMKKEMKKKYEKYIVMAEGNKKIALRFLMEIKGQLPPEVIDYVME